MTTTRRIVSMPEMTEEQIRVHRAGEALHRDGGSPAGTLELLAAIVEDDTWRKVRDVKGVAFDGRFRDFVSARPPFGLGCEPAQLLKVIGLRHPHESAAHIAVRMEAMRTAVQALLLESIDAARPPRQKGSDRGTIRSEIVETTLARLKRDDPDLARRVISGEISANAAAREKGWRHPRIVVSSPHRVAEALRRTMDTDDLNELVRILAGDKT